MKQPVLVDCQCGYSGVNILGHYDIVRCTCGLFYWALRPKRNGLLVAYPYPGQHTGVPVFAQKPGKSGV